MCYQSSQFNRYLVSSPLLSTSSQKDCSDESQDKTGDNTTPSPSSTSTTATNVSKTTTMLIRSPQNFNAKISSCSNALACEQQNLLNSSKNFRTFIEVTVVLLVCSQTSVVLKKNFFLILSFKYSELP